MRQRPCLIVRYFCLSLQLISKERCSGSAVQEALFKKCCSGSAIQEALLQQLDHATGMRNCRLCDLFNSAAKELFHERIAAIELILPIYFSLDAAIAPILIRLKVGDKAFTGNPS